MSKTNTQKLTKQQIKDILEALSIALLSAPTVKLEDNNTYNLDSNYGKITMRLRLGSDLPTIFTRLETPLPLNNRGFNRFTGKRNYFGIDEIYNFINQDIVVDDIVLCND